MLTRGRLTRGENAPSLYGNAIFSQSTFFFNYFFLLKEEVWSSSDEIKVALRFGGRSPGERGAGGGGGVGGGRGG